MNVLKDKKAWLIFILPALIFYLGTVFVPIIQSLKYGFQQWNGIQEPRYIGFDNYIAMFKDSYFWNAVQNNLVYVVIVVFMQVFIGLFFALLLSYVNKGAGIFRTLYYLPAVVVTIAIAQMFRNFYSLQPLGLLNMFLDWVGLSHLQSAWLSNPDTALIAVSIPEGWRFIGMYMVIFYAALIAIPKEIEEAAKIDGVNGWQLIRYIKLPSIMHVLSLSLIMCTTGALRGFDIPYIIGVPGSSTELVTTYMYKQAFSTIQYGYGSSIAVFIVIESLLAVLLIRAIFNSRKGDA
ncbi:raffinose/stachyose/melibiose transport system permease protein [Paenibacillus algorifonticola]|uniref:Raffinose/stachyose/melibiose transport system permease protein n=1 Tax=Paenibacillus algorifonticola TaxID=684063 RepID=A0A1I2FFL6_9BACL|nr:sugar ABC transporter permease [Paenibacillus algorifonticola]SFF03783.1 raffinose/stachyose/melibiose transport system permease protein [Paenibacillus algorifonticola]